MSSTQHFHCQGLNASYNQAYEAKSASRDLRRQLYRQLGPQSSRMPCVGGQWADASCERYPEQQQRRLSEDEVMRKSNPDAALYSHKQAKQFNDRFMPRIHVTQQPEFAKKETCFEWERLGDLCRNERMRSDRSHEECRSQDHFSDNGSDDAPPKTSSFMEQQNPARSESQSSYGEEASCEDDSSNALSQTYIEKKAKHLPRRKNSFSYYPEKVQASDSNSRPESELSEDNFDTKTEFEPQYPPTEIKWLKMPEEEAPEKKETPQSMLGKRCKLSLGRSLEQCDALGKIQKHFDSHAVSTQSKEKDTHISEVSSKIGSSINRRILKASEKQAQPKALQKFSSHPDKLYQDKSSLLMNSIISPSFLLQAGGSPKRERIGSISRLPGASLASRSNSFQSSELPLRGCSGLDDCLSIPDSIIGGPLHGKISKPSSFRPHCSSPPSQDCYQSDIQPSKPKKSSKKQAYFDEIKSKAELLAKIFNGSLKSESNFSMCRGIPSIRFNCQNEHNFYLAAEEISGLDLDQIKAKYKKYRLSLQNIQKAKDSLPPLPPPSLGLPDSCWCSRCVEFYSHSAASHNSQLLEIIGGLFTKQIMYRCRKNPSHIFYSSSIRKHAFQKQYRIQDYSCPDCKKEEKDRLKRQAMEEVEKQRKILEEKQRQIFEEINSKHQEEPPRSQPAGYAEDIKWRQRQEKEINERAMYLSRSFINSIKEGQIFSCPPSPNQSQSVSNEDSLASDNVEMADIEKMQQLSFEQVFLIYKFLETPLPMLIEGMRSKSEEQLKKYFKQVALQLHPDKNAHPKAKQTFQKIKKAMDEANKLRHEYSCY